MPAKRRTQVGGPTTPITATGLVSSSTIDVDEGPASSLPRTKSPLSSTNIFTNIFDPDLSTNPLQQPQQPTPNKIKSVEENGDGGGIPGALGSRVDLTSPTSPLVPYRTTAAPSPVSVENTNPTPIYSSPLPAAKSRRRHRVSTDPCMITSPTTTTATTALHAPASPAAGVKAEEIYELSIFSNSSEVPSPVNAHNKISMLPYFEGAAGGQVEQPAYMTMSESTDTRLLLSELQMTSFPSPTDEDLISSSRQSQQQGSGKGISSAFLIPNGIHHPLGTRPPPLKRSPLPSRGDESSSNAFLRNSIVNSSSAGSPGGLGALSDVGGVSTTSTVFTALKSFAPAPSPFKQPQLHTPTTTSVEVDHGPAAHYNNGWSLRRLRSVDENSKTPPATPRSPSNINWKVPHSASSGCSTPTVSPPSPPPNQQPSHTPTKTTTTTTFTNTHQPHFNNKHIDHSRKGPPSTSPAHPKRAGGKCDEEASSVLLSPSLSLPPSTHQTPIKVQESGTSSPAQQQHQGDTMDKKNAKFWQDRLKRPPNSFSPERGGPTTTTPHTTSPRTTTVATTPNNKNIRGGAVTSPGSTSRGVPSPPPHMRVATSGVTPLSTQHNNHPHEHYPNHSGGGAVTLPSSSAPPPLVWWLDCMQTLAFSLAETAVESTSATKGLSSQRQDVSGGDLGLEEHEYMQIERTLEQLRTVHQRLKLDLSQASLSGRSEASYLTTRFGGTPGGGTTGVRNAFSPALSEPFQLRTGSGGMDSSVTSIEFPHHAAGGGGGDPSASSRRSVSPGVANRSPSTATTVASNRKAHHHDPTTLSSDAQRLQARVDRDLEVFSTLCERLMRRSSVMTQHAKMSASRGDHNNHNSSPARNKFKEDGVDFETPTAALLGGGGLDEDGGKDRKLIHILRDRAGELEAALVTERSKTAGLRQELRQAKDRVEELSEQINFNSVGGDNNTSSVAASQKQQHDIHDLQDENSQLRTQVAKLEKALAITCRRADVTLQLSSPPRHQTSLPAHKSTMTDWYEEDYCPSSGGDNSSVNKGASEVSAIPIGRLEEDKRQQQQHNVNTAEVNTKGGGGDGDLEGDASSIHYQLSEVGDGSDDEEEDPPKSRQMSPVPRTLDNNIKRSNNPPPSSNSKPQQPPPLSTHAAALAALKVADDNGDPMDVYMSPAGSPPAKRPPPPPRVIGTIVSEDSQASPSGRDRSNSLRGSAPGKKPPARTGMTVDTCYGGGEGIIVNSRDASFALDQSLSPTTFFASRWGSTRNLLTPSSPKAADNPTSSSLSPRGGGAPTGEGAAVAQTSGVARTPAVAQSAVDTIASTQRTSATSPGAVSPLKKPVRAPPPKHPRLSISDSDMGPPSLWVPPQSSPKINSASVNGVRRPSGSVTGPPVVPLSLSLSSHRQQVGSAGIIDERHDDDETPWMGHHHHHAHDVFEASPLLLSSSYRKHGGAVLVLASGQMTGAPRPPPTRPPPTPTNNQGGASSSPAHSHQQNTPSLPPTRNSSIRDTNRHKQLFALPPTTTPLPTAPQRQDDVVMDTDKQSNRAAHRGKNPRADDDRKKSSSRRHRHDPSSSQRRYYDEESFLTTPSSGSTASSYTPSSSSYFSDSQFEGPEENGRHSRRYPRRSESGGTSHRRRDNDDRRRRSTTPRGHRSRGETPPGTTPRRHGSSHRRNRDRSPTPSRRDIGQGTPNRSARATAPSSSKPRHDNERNNTANKELIRSNTANKELIRSNTASKELIRSNTANKELIRNNTANKELKRSNTANYGGDVSAMSNSREWVVGGMEDGRVAPLHHTMTPSNHRGVDKKKDSGMYGENVGDVVHLPYTSADELEVVSIPLIGSLGEAIYDPNATPNTIRTIRTNMAAAKLIYHLQSTTPRRRHHADNTSPPPPRGDTSKEDRASTVERELQRRLQKQ